MVPAESNTATGLPVVSASNATPGQMALQRKLRHLEVPASSSTETSQEGVLNPTGDRNYPAPRQARLSRESGADSKQPGIG